MLHACRMFVQPTFLDFTVQRSMQQCWLAAAGMQQGRGNVMWAGCAFSKYLFCSADPEGSLGPSV